MSEYINKLMEKAGMKSSKNNPSNPYGLSDEEYAKLDREYATGEDPVKLYKISGDKITSRSDETFDGVSGSDLPIIETSKGYFLVGKGDSRSRIKELTKLMERAQDPEQVANLTNRERMILEREGVSRKTRSGSDASASGIADMVDRASRAFRGGREPSKFWTGEKPTYYIPEENKSLQYLVDLYKNEKPEKSKKK
jgi:hypothetical protein